MERLFCPVCGKSIIQPGESFEAPNCDHVEWVYLDELHEFIFAQPEVQAQFDELSEQADGDDDLDPFEEFQKVWSGNTNFILNVRTGGIACGPVWETVRFGLNLVPEED